MVFAFLVMQITFRQPARVMLAMFHLTEDSIENHDQKFIVHISRAGFFLPEAL